MAKGENEVKVWGCSKQRHTELSGELTEHNYCTWRDMSTFHDATTPGGPRPLIIEVSHSHSATSNTVRLLWTSDQPLTTHNTHNRLMSSPRRDSNPQSQQASCQRLHGHWDQLYVNVVNALSVKHYKIRLVSYTGVFL